MGRSQLELQAAGDTERIRKIVHERHPLTRYGSANWTRIGCKTKPGPERRSERDSLTVVSSGGNVEVAPVLKLISSDTGIERHERCEVPRHEIEHHVGRRSPYIRVNEHTRNGSRGDVIPADVLHLSGER